MVTHLARVLRVPLDGQNQLLGAAGYAAAFAETSVDDLAEVGDALEFMLQAHEPNMALVVDHAWNVVFANGAALALSGALAPDPPLFEGRLNVMYAMFHPDGLGAHLMNRAEVEPMLLWRLLDDLDRSPDNAELARLIDAVRALSSFAPADLPAHRGIVGTVRYALDVGEVSLFSCLASIESSADITLAGLRLETFFPADAASAVVWSNFVDAAAGQPA